MKVKNPLEINPISMKGKLKFLFFSLLVLLIVYPHLEDTNFEAAILNIAFSIVLMTGVYAVSYDKTHLLVGILLGIPALVTNWLNYPSNNLLIAHIFAILFYIYAVVSILTYLIKAEKITSDVLYGAASVYILVGITFGAGYSLLESIQPGSFMAQSDASHWSDLVYFSFTTLTTVGYGDVTPLTTNARSIAIIEMLAGQMYMAMVMARLVGIYVIQKKHFQKKST